MSLKVNSYKTIQDIDTAGATKAKQEIKTEEKPVALNRDEVNRGKIARGFNAGGAGISFGAMVGMLVSKSDIAFGAYVGVAAGVVAGVVASQTTDSWWKGSLIGGSVGAATGTVIGLVTGWGCATGAIIGAAAGTVSGAFGAVTPTKVINL